MIHNNTPVGTLKLMYEMGLAARDGRIPEAPARHALLVLPQIKGGQTSYDELEVERKVYERLGGKESGLKLEGTLTCNQMTQGVIAAQLFLLKAMADGTIARLSEGIRQGTQDEFARAFSGEEPVG